MQVERHPLFRNEALRTFCSSHGGHITAYSPLARGQAINHPVVHAAAAVVDDDEEEHGDDDRDEEGGGAISGGVGCLWV